MMFHETFYVWFDQKDDVYERNGMIIYVLFPSENYQKYDWYDNLKTI